VKMWIEYEISENALLTSAAPHLEVKWRLAWGSRDSVVFTASCPRQLEEGVLWLGTEGSKNNDSPSYSDPLGLGEAVATKCERLRHGRQSCLNVAGTGKDSPAVQLLHFASVKEQAGRFAEIDVN